MTRATHETLEGQRRRYTTFVIEGDTAFRNIRDEWEDLWQTSTEATESQTWDFVAAYSTHVTRTRPIVLSSQGVGSRCLRVSQ